MVDYRLKAQTIETLVIDQKTPLLVALRKIAGIKLRHAWAKLKWAGAVALCLRNR